jgi:hypothetical protein
MMNSQVYSLPRSSLAFLFFFLGHLCYVSTAHVARLEPVLGCDYFVVSVLIYGEGWSEADG